MRKLLLAIALLSLVCIPALAQDAPVAEVYGGYQLFRHPGGDGYDGYNLHGFLASVEGNLKPYFGIVGEFGYNRKTWDEYNETETFSSFLFGPRFGYRAGNFRVFGHYLLGAVRYSADWDGDDYSDTNFGQAIGGGVDISLNNMISIRPAQLDMVSVKWPDNDGGWENHFRYSAGVVIKFGSK